MNHPAGGKKWIPFVYFRVRFVYLRYAAVAVKPLISNKTNSRQK
jgi:hypothetical protein